MIEASDMLKQVMRSVKLIAHEEIMPRYLKVAHQRKTDGSLFTEADMASQEALTRDLRSIANYPVLGEEMPHEVQRELWQAGKDGIWCVDPIDGTSNFVNGLPYFAVSVALMRDGKSILGVIYDPIADEIFYAERGQGAYLNGERLPIKEYSPELRRAMAGVDFKRLPERLALQLAEDPPYSSQRNYGASTLDWCYTAAGRFDVYLHGGQKLWDYAAGSLILEEAGGSVCTMDNDEFWGGDPWHRSVIAALNLDLFIGWKSWIRAAIK